MSNADAAIAGGAESPRDEVDELITRTRARGSVTITTGEIFSALPKLEPETDELAAIFERIQASGFDIIDEVIDDIRREDERAARRRRAGRAPGGRPRRRSLRPPQHDPGASAAPARHSRTAARPDRSEGGGFDPVRMYLKEIGKVPLLTGPQEVSLAKRIEAGVHATERLEDVTAPLTDTPLSMRPGRRCRRWRSTATSPRSSSPRPTSASSCRSPSATSAGAWRCSISCRRATSA